MTWKWCKYGANKLQEVSKKILGLNEVDLRHLDISRQGGKPQKKSLRTENLLPDIKTRDIPNK
jgi:hypothetical protein